jgi:hypothetical protein
MVKRNRLQRQTGPGGCDPEERDLDRPLGGGKSNHLHSQKDGQGNDKPNDYPRLKYPSGAKRLFPADRPDSLSKKFSNLKSKWVHRFDHVGERKDRDDKPQAASERSVEPVAVAGEDGSDQPNRG